MNDQPKDDKTAKMRRRWIIIGVVLALLLLKGWVSSETHRGELAGEETRARQDLQHRIDAANR